MTEAHKSENPAATGFNAKQNTDAKSIAPAEKIGNPDKRLATLRARAAMAGITLCALENDSRETVYIVSRWALTRELPDLEAVSAWLEQVTGVRHDRH